MDETRPSEAALKAAADALPITWGRQLVHDVALALDRFAAQQREAAQKVIEAIADMEGTEGMTDHIFAERALMLVNEYLRPIRKLR